MATQAAIADYPVRFEVLSPEGQNRWSNNTTAYQLFHNQSPPFSMS
jgi:hypothetical protein